MSGKPKKDEGAPEFLDRLADFLWGDQEGETTEDVCRELREEGLDPEGFQARIRNLVAQAKDERRLSWMHVAEREREAALARLSRVDLASLDRGELLRRIAESGQIAARGLDTPLEEMDDSELRAICEEIEWASNLDGNASTQEP